MLQRERLDINRILNYLACLILLLYLSRVILSVFNVFVNSTMWNIPNEYRDFAGFRLTYLFLDGINPYTLDTVQNMTNPDLYLYSALSPLLAAIICKISGMRVISAWYLLNIIYWIGSGYLFYKILTNGNGKNKPIKLFYSLIFAGTCISRLGTYLFNLRQDAIGVLVYAFIMYLVLTYPQKTFPIAAFSVLLFFTKQVFVVMVIPIVLYYLIYDRRSFAKYILQSVCIGISVLLLLYLFLPLYLTNTVFFQLFCIDGVLTFESAKINIHNFYQRYYFIWIIDIIVCILMFASAKKHYMDKAFSYALYLWFNIGIATLSLLYFAQNGEDGYKYCQEMLGPAVILVGIYTLENNLVENPLKDRTLFSKSLVQTVSIILMTLAVPKMIWNYRFPEYSINDVMEYDKVSRIIDGYSYDQVYLGPAVTFYMLEKPDYIFKGFYDDGHIQYFQYYAHPDFCDKYFYMDEVTNLYERYRRLINNKINNRDFLLIVGNSYLIDQDILDKNYKLQESHILKNDSQSWNVDIWVPK